MGTGVNVNQDKYLGAAEREREMRDVLEGVKREYEVLDHGRLVVLDVMPRLVERGADDAIVQAARTSIRGGLKSDADDKALIEYLMRHEHTTPFEMAEVKVWVKMPIFVARQWIRHRTANVNEASARYKPMAEEQYAPTEVRSQSTGNKQGSEGVVTDSDTVREMGAYLDAAERQFKRYERLVGAGVALEQARIGLPLSQYTEMVWKCDLHNILRLLGLRVHKHAQEEIRAYGEALMAVCRDVFPWTMAAFEKYKLGGIRLSAAEIEAIRERAELKGTLREKRELGEKLELLGLN